MSPSLEGAAANLSSKIYESREELGCTYTVQQQQKQQQQQQQSKRIQKTADNPSCIQRNTRATPLQPLLRTPTTAATAAATVAAVASAAAAAAAAVAAALTVWQSLLQREGDGAHSLMNAERGPPKER